MQVNKRICDYEGCGEEIPTKEKWDARCLGGHLWPLHIDAPGFGDVRVDYHLLVDKDLCDKHKRVALEEIMFPLVMGVRPEVVRFAIDMERRLKEHDAGRGDQWKTMGWLRLFDRLAEEIDELDTAMMERSDSVRSEAADVANFAMFIAETNEPTGD